MHYSGAVEAVASVCLPLPRIPHVVQSQIPQLAERVALPNRRKAVWGIRLPLGGRRASPLTCYNWQGICTGNRDEFSPVVHSLRAVSGSICHSEPSQEREIRTFSGDYGHFSPLLVKLCFASLLSSAGFLCPLNSSGLHSTVCGHIIVPRLGRSVATFANVRTSLGSKYRFCVPQNRRLCRRAAGHSGEQTIGMKPR